MTKTCGLLQKLNAELKRIISDIDGGAMSVIIMGIAGFFVAILIFLSIADISIYSYKKRLIGVALDYAVSAAVQEIDTEKSRDGIARAFSNDGKVSMTGVYFNEAKADKAFESTITDNINIDLKSMNNKLIRVMVSPETDGIYYSMRDINKTEAGHSENIDQIESILNNRMNSLGNTVDNHKVFVNGNAASNSFEKRPYYMVFIRDYEIDGLISHRKATFICFKAAKIYR